MSKSDLKLPPQNLEAEECVLGSILIEGELAAVKVMDILVPSDFYKEINGIIFKEICTMVAHDRAIDILTLTEQLKSSGLLDDSDNAFYVTGLLEAVPSSANIEYYANIVKERSKRRSIIVAAQTASQHAYDNSKPLAEIEQELMSCLVSESDTGYVLAEQAALESLANIDNAITKKIPMGLMTGFPEIDNITGGLRKKDYIVLAALTSVGKSSLALQIATNIAGQGKHVGYVSLEMTRDQIADRAIFAKAGIDSMEYTHGRLTKDHLAPLNKAGEWFGNLPIYIDDQRNQTVWKIYARAKKLQMQGKLDLLIIDYLGVITPHEGKNSYERMTAISHELFLVAGRLGIPTLVLHQLNRDSLKRTDGRPQMSDLRDSGNIEQDADVIMLIFRPEKQRIAMDKSNHNAIYEKGYSEVILPKNRKGATGTAELKFVERLSSFKSIDRYTEEDF